MQAQYWSLFLKVSCIKLNQVIPSKKQPEVDKLAKYSLETKMFFIGSKLFIEAMNQTQQKSGNTGEFEADQRLIGYQLIQDFSHKKNSST